MITNKSGERVTPKIRAQLAIMEAVTCNVMGEIKWDQGITDGELYKVQSQIRNQVQRVEKMFNMEPGTYEVKT